MVCVCDMKKTYACVKLDLTMSNYLTCYLKIFFAKSLKNSE